MRNLFLALGLALLITSCGNGTDPAKSVVRVTNQANKAGGTGFHVKAPSGKVIIITNAHVCEGVNKDGQVYVSFDESPRPIPRRILEISTQYDLCAVEPLEGGLPLHLAEKEAAKGDVLESWGHPKLLPLTRLKGNLIGEQEVKIIKGPTNPNDPNDCNLPKNKKEYIDTFFFSGEVCLIVVKAFATTIMALGGSSGSPVLNAAGEVMGVVFASSGFEGWALLVQLKEVKLFLVSY